MKYLILFLLIFFISCGGKTPNSSSNERSTEAATAESSEFLEILNLHRQGLGLTALKYHNTIHYIAFTHSDDMADGKIPFGHEGFSSRCAEIRSQLGGNACGENVARGQKSAQAVFNSWLSSSGHRKAMESVKYTHIGLAKAMDAQNKAYWTLILFQL